VRPTILDEPTWRAAKTAHEAHIDDRLSEHLERRRHGRKHPVEDFLFTYYSYRPNQLRRWHPGAGVVLVGAAAAELGPDYRETADGAILDDHAVRARRSDSIAWIARLLRETSARPAHFGCFGMHEWAMVYRLSPDEIRHAAWPLRLGPDGTDAVVDANPVRCSHFDAYRFFTPPARPLNLLQPTRETQSETEQPGCLHANMDLYKWAYKLAPLTSSDLVVACFALAREIRTLDMRASPYELSGLGLDPVRIETVEGRSEYIRHQRDFADRAAVLRETIVDLL
jgi:hypothetical protein